MKPNLVDTKIAKIIKHIRKLKGIKQFHLAQALNMKECNYSKFENAHKAFTSGQVKAIADYMKINWKLIFYFAEVEIDFKAIGSNNISIEYIIRKKN